MRGEQRRASLTSTPRYSSTANRGWFGITSPGGAFHVSSRIATSPSAVVSSPGPDRERRVLRIAEHRDRALPHPHRAVEDLPAEAATSVTSRSTSSWPKYGIQFGGVEPMRGSSGIIPPFSRSPLLITR